MNCPGHLLVFASEVRSYRDLPIRYPRADAAAPQRSVGRALGADARPAVLPGRCALLRDGVADWRRGRAAAAPGAAGLRRLRPEATAMKLSTRPAEFLGEIATWDHAEAELKRALEAAGQAYTINEGDGAFYGPKIDFDVTDAIGRKWQCATIQLDYQMPERFDLKYIGADNAEHRPVVIHRAIFGSFERFIALLIEHYAGRVPAVAGAGAGDRAADCRSPRRRTPRRWSATLKAAGLRVDARRAAGEDRVQDSGSPAPESAVHAGGGRSGSGRRHGVGPQPQRRRPRIAQRRGVPRRRRDRGREQGQPRGHGR